MKNVFATGKVSMTMLEEPGLSGSAAVVAVGATHKGCFVMWEMLPNKWSIELVVGDLKVLAGSDGKLAWRYTPWLGSHAAKGAVRPLRRALQVAPWFFHFSTMACGFQSELTDKGLSLIHI